MLLNGAQIVMEELIKNGVDTVFGYPGGTVLPLYDELYKYSTKINHVITAHEQGASFAADGYARSSGKTGVVIATSGPGATNIVTGIANAYLDSIPVVAITGNVALPSIGKDSFQEVDIVSVTQPMVKHNFMVRDIKNLQTVLSEAFRLANEGRKGPVLIDIPKNIQVELCEYEEEPKSVNKERAFPILSDEKLAEIAAMINSAKKPFIYAGGGIISSSSESLLLELSQKLDAPVGLSMMGITALPASYPLNLGMCGMHGKYASSVAQDNCDLMIALGVRFSDRATGNVDAYRKDKKIIHIDIDIAEIEKNVSTTMGICADLNKTISDLIPLIDKKENSEWINDVCEYKKVESILEDTSFIPENIIKTVKTYANPDTVIATDVGQHQMWAIQYYPFEQPRTLLTSGGLGAMGYGLGAAIGASLAKDKKFTILFTGDGSFGMNLNELMTCVSQELPILIIILNNNVLGMVRQWQTMFFDQRYSATTLNRKTDFVALTEAFGGTGFRASNLDELKEALSQINPSGPTVIDCQIDMDKKVFPMIPPGGSVKDMITKED